MTTQWHDEIVTPLELDETGRWVTVRTNTGAIHTACIDELQGFDPLSVPQVDAGTAVKPSAVKSQGRSTR